MYTLAYVLENVDKFKWSDALFLPEDEVWYEKTEGMILDPDDVEDENDDIPKKAKDKKLMYALNIQTIQAIVRNALQQKKDITVEELVEAYLFYYDNDAYMDFMR